MSINFVSLVEEAKKDETIMYLVLSGDRMFNQNSSMVMKVDGHDEMISGYDLYKALLLKMVGRRLDEGFKIDIRCGDNKGVDAMAERWGKENDHVVHRIEADWSRGSSAGYLRNENLYLFIGTKPHKGSLLLWDGEDVYTRHLMFCAWAQSVPLRVWNYVKKSWLSKDEIFDIQMAVRSEQVQHGRLF